MLLDIILCIKFVFKYISFLKLSILTWVIEWMIQYLVIQKVYAVYANYTYHLSTLQGQSGFI